MSIKKTLKYYGISSIWHFTDLSNLESIEENGVLSLRNLIKKKIDVSCYGADNLSHNLDRRYGLDKYVHLSFIKEHPMQYVKTRDGDIPNPIWLEIDASILFNSDSMFSDQVANKTDAKIYDIEELAEHIDLDVLWGRTDWKDSKIQQRRRSAKYGEIMIKDEICIRDILGVSNGK